MSFPYDKYRSITQPERSRIPTLDILFLKSMFVQTSDFWWILREQYKEHPERFTLLSLNHSSNDEAQQHFNLGYQVNDKFQQTYHVYYENKHGKTRFTNMTAESLNRERIKIVEFR